jgi:hypothetical protein
MTLQNCMNLHRNWVLQVQHLQTWWIWWIQVTIAYNLVQIFEALFENHSCNDSFLYISPRHGWNPSIPTSQIRIWLDLSLKTLCWPRSGIKLLLIGFGSKETFDVYENILWNLRSFYSKTNPLFIFKKTKTLFLTKDLRKTLKPDYDSVCNEVGIEIGVEIVTYIIHENIRTKNLDCGLFCMFYTRSFCQLSGEKTKY